MKAPQFFLGAVVLFWGWQVDLLWIAVFIALILESARVIQVKFEFKPTDVNKFVDISIVLLAGSVLIALTREPENAILIILKWLPLIFFPIIGVQEFSASSKIDVQSFFIVTRKRVKFIGHETREIDISLAYGFFCLVSAGTANTGGHLFYICVAAFFAWALHPFRSRRSSLMVWSICLVVVITAGVAGHTGIHAFRKKISRWMMAYYMGYYQADPFKAFTALGDIGTLKLSDKIVLRVSAKDYQPGKTYLLHTATYNKFYISNWSMRSRFESVSPGSDETSWQINPLAGENVQQMIVYSRPIKKRAILSLPAGVTTITDMRAGFCEKNEMQVVRVDDTPSLIKATVSFTGKLTFDPKPYDHDLMIPDKELPPIINISKTLALETKSPSQVLTTLQHYFLNEYTYSLEMKGKEKQDTPLVNFFTHTRAGHCEFFATATALLLRHAGIPARYATGFIAHEYSWMENLLKVRQRDAHAWVKVYINGQWENFDTTPPSFLELDRRENTSSVISDFFSFLGFTLSRLRHETGARLMERYGLWLILPLGVILFFRLRKSNKIKRAVKLQTETEDQEPENRPTAFYLIEEMMSRKGFPRHPYETYQSWLDRIGYYFDTDEPGDPDETDDSGIVDQSISTRDRVQTLLQIHNQWRFSRSGLQGTEREKFDLDVNALLIKMAPEK